MGREGENLPLARASGLSAIDAFQGVGCRAWRITRATRLSFGNERAAPLVFPVRLEPRKAWRNG